MLPVASVAVTTPPVLPAIVFRLVTDGLSLILIVITSLESVASDEKLAVSPVVAVAVTTPAVLPASVFKAETDIVSLTGIVITSVAAGESDAKAAARAIDLYKSDMGLFQTKKSFSSKDAAKAVSKTNTRSEPSGEEAGMVKESVVQKMSAQQYEKNADKIMEAIRSGKFIYDVSGGAR